MDSSDGELTLFDMNFSVLRVLPQEAFALACGRELKPGKQLTVHLPQHYTKDALWREQRRSCRISAYRDGLTSRQNSSDHLKRILRLGRLRLRGPRGAQDEFTLAAIAQNLRKLAKLLIRPPPDHGAACVAAA